MSIDARVRMVLIEENGGGSLALEDRPPTRRGDTGGIAGQSTLSFDTAPEEVAALNGLNIWGGSSDIMLGDRKIADRVGYTRILFVDGEEFKRAVTEYHRRRATSRTHRSCGWCGTQFTADDDRRVCSSVCGQKLYEAKTRDGGYLP